MAGFLDSWGGGVLAQGQTDHSGAVMALGCMMIILAIAALLGAAKCGRIAGRPETSSVCVWSLGVLLLGYAVPMALLLVLGGAGVAERETPGHTALSMVLVAVVFGAVLASVVMAIVGLATYSHHRPPYNQGRAQAVWSLVLSGLLVLGFGGLVVGAAVKGFNEREGQSTTVARGESLRFDTFNFSVDAPGRPWVMMDAEVLHPDAALVMRRTRPEVFWFVIPEIAGEGTGITDDLLVEVAQATIKSQADRPPKIGSVRDDEVAGMPASRFDVYARMGGNDLYYDFRVIFHQGYAYQLITSGIKANRADVVRASDELADAFVQIDPDRVGNPAEVGEPIDRLARPDHGFELTLDYLHWSRWDSLEEDFPEAAAGGIVDGFGYLTVTPVPLEGIALRDETLIDGLMRDRGMTLPRETARRVKNPGASGYVFDNVTMNEDGTTATYHTRIVRNENWAYLLLGWTLGNNEPALKRIADAAARIEFDPRARPVVDPARRDWVALSLNDLGMAAYNNGEMDTALAGFRAAYKATPESETYATNVLQALNDLRRYEDAVRFAQTHVEAFPDHHEARAAYALNLRWVDREEDAAEVYEALFEDGYDDAFSIGDYLDGLEYMGQAQRGLDWLDRYDAKTGPGRPDHSLRRGKFLAMAGRHDEALEQLEALVKRPLAGDDARVALLDALVQADRAAEAVQRAEEMAGAGHDSSAILFNRGLAEFELKWYPQAHRSFRQAYDRQADAATKNYLDHTADLLGRGDNELIRKPIPAVEWPDDVVALVKELESRPWQEPPGYSAAYLQRVRAIDLPADGPRRTSLSHTVRINDPAALERFSTLEFSFDPGHEALFVNEVVIRDARGEVVAHGDPDRYFVADKDDGVIHDTDKTATIPVPGLSVGHVLSYTVTWRDDYRRDEVEFSRTHFVNLRPARYEMTFVSGEADRVAAEKYGEVETLRDTETLKAWAVHDPPIHRWEPFQPKWTTIYPTLVLGQTGQAWEDLGKEYLGRLRPTLDASAATPDLAERVFADTETDADAIAAALRYVQNLLTYEALEFGVRGQIPHRVDEIVRQRFGDCKDHTLLLWHLMRERGIEAHLALVNSDEPAVPELPSLGQFDHMVLFVPGQGDRPDVLLDGTDEEHPAWAGPPVGLGEKTLFVLDPDAPRLVTAPPYAGTMAVRSNRKVQVQPDGELLIHESLELDGYAKEGMISYLAGMSAQQRPRRLESLMSKYGQVQLDHLEVSDLTDLVSPLRLTFTYRVGDAFHRDGAGWTGRLPSVWERDYAEPTRVTDRQSPFNIRYAQVVETGVELVPPPGYRVAEAPDGVEGSNPYATWRAAARRAEAHGGTILASRVERKTGQHSAEAYAAYERTLRDGLRPLLAPIRLVPAE